ncbi:MAG: hypothetical protein ACTSPB_00590 [Candidatus Thorarchaeota archaeon]
MNCPLCQGECDGELITPVRYFFTDDEHHREFNLLGMYFHSNCLGKMKSKVEDGKIVLYLEEKGEEINNV